ncbi:hypothetical protein GCM10008020_23810 [Massilia psychrophila]|nr:hypothetical protein GCM10008020_23810 [Massilia psychrophila]
MALRDQAAYGGKVEAAVEALEVDDQQVDLLMGEDVHGLRGIFGDEQTAELPAARRLEIDPAAGRRIEKQPNLPGAVFKLLRHTLSSKHGTALRTLLSTHSLP